MFKKINWTNTLFLIFTPLFGVGGLIGLWYTHALHWQTFLLTFILMVTAGLSITAGYHRLFSHSTYKAKWPVRLFFALFGAAAFEGSILEWCTDHRDHHRYTDTEKDPYNINQGFWYAHIGWLFTLDVSKRNFSNVEDLAKDPVVRFQHKFVVILGILFGFVLPMAIGSLWGDALGGLLIAGALRITITQQFTFCINSICHVFGKQTFTDRNTARDNWVTALFTFGEGYHNFHHKFPLDYRNGIRLFDFDPSKWTIKALELFGLASNLKRVSDTRILQCKLESQRSYILQQAERYRGELIEKLQEIVQPTYQYLTQAVKRLDELEKSYQQLKASKAEYMRDRLEEYKGKLKEYRDQISQAKDDVNRQLRIWASLVDNALPA